MIAGAAADAPTIWIEIEEALRFFDLDAQPSGIQRVCIELCVEAERQYGSRIKFCRLSRYSHVFVPIELKSLLVAANAQAVAATFGASPRERRAATALSRFGRYLSGPLLTKLHDRIKRRRDRRSSDRLFAPGDIVLCLVCTMNNGAYAKHVMEAKRQLGIKFAILIHDIIAATHDTLFNPNHVAAFRRWLNEIIPASDVVFVSSDHVRSELLAYGRDFDRPPPSPEIIHFGAGFQQHNSAGTEHVRMLPQRYVLLVSTIEVRKNHRLLVKIWQRLMEKHGAAALPNLVFIGRIGWKVDDLTIELAASNYLDGKVTIISGLSDAGLGEAYRRCLFTVYPSLCEGWGLPVAESLAQGKFCVTSNRASLPEVGGDFADYFDPDDENDALAKIERVLFEPGYREAREARLRRDYRPPNWADCARDLIAKLDVATSRPGAIRPQVSPSAVP